MLVDLRTPIGLLAPLEVSVLAPRDLTHANDGNNYIVQCMGCEVQCDAMHEVQDLSWCKIGAT
jgi:hypothetical protein